MRDGLREWLEHVIVFGFSYDDEGQGGNNAAKRKPRPGVPSSNPALHPGQNVPQSIAALGLSWSVVSRTRQSEAVAGFLPPDFGKAPELENSHRIRVQRASLGEQSFRNLQRRDGCGYDRRVSVRRDSQDQGEIATR